MGDDARTPVEEPLWKRIILAVPRGFGSLVRSVAGVGEFDPVYRRDGLCFLLIVLAVFFCASEWFRVNGIIGRVLHAFSAGVLGVMSVVLPVLLVIVAIRLMRNSGKNSDNPRVVSGWAILLWSVCSIIDVVVAADARSFDIACCKGPADCLVSCWARLWHGDCRRCSPLSSSWWSACSRC